MVIFENSLVGGLLLRLWYVLCRWYEGSAVHRGLTALSLSLIHISEPPRH